MMNNKYELLAYDTKNVTYLIHPNTHEYSDPTIWNICINNKKNEEALLYNASFFIQFLCPVTGYYMVFIRKV